MKKLKFPLIVLAAAVAAAMPLSAQQTKMNSSGGNSPHETTGAVIGGRGGDRVTIMYGRPFAKDRVIKIMWENSQFSVPFTVQK